MVIRDVRAIWLAAKDKRTPRLARILAMATAAYALSPIDLIPDFIPIVGYLDDVVIVPVCIILIIKLVPDVLMCEFRHRADGLKIAAGWIAPVVVLCVWLLFLLFLIR